MIMNPLKSIVARYQGYILTNIQKSKYGKKLRKIKNAHKGERCFIVANGPSLTSDDLEKIYQNNEYSFGTFLTLSDCFYLLFPGFTLHSLSFRTM